MQGMDIRNCKNCGRLYQYDGNKLCQKCRNDEGDEFFKVREYIYDHPNASIVEVSEETGVEEEKILAYLRQGRLELKGENLILDCERCGKPISTGRFCNSCINEMQKELSQAAKGMSAPQEHNKAAENRNKDDRMYSQERKSKK